MFVRTPIGPEASRWRTVTPDRHVLIVAHNVTAMTRLLDVMPLFEGDFRIQLTVMILSLTACTRCSPGSAFP